jgi:hypothetical protein
MRPQFANIFHLGVNQNKSEFLLDFHHGYTTHNYSPKQNGLIDVPVQTADQVASLLLTREGAVALMKLLQNTLEDME